MNICLSGGADGADFNWGKHALLNEHQLIHFSFDGHGSKVKDNLYILSKDELLKADQYLISANKSLKRRWPVSNPYVANLLRRNYYQICNTESVYAVGKMVNGQIDGGTAWATQMYIDRCYTEDIECNLYFLNQEENKWLKLVSNKTWVRIDPPKPSGTWTGIGTRQLNENGINAITSLMTKYPFPIKEKPERGDIIYVCGEKNLIGGWATVAAIQSASPTETFTFIQEYGSTVCYNWESNLKEQQRDLRQKFGLSRAHIQIK